MVDGPQELLRGRLFAPLQAKTKHLPHFLSTKKTKLQVVLFSNKNKKTFHKILVFWIIKGNILNIGS